MLPGVRFIHSGDRLVIDLGDILQEDSQQPQQHESQPRRGRQL